MSDYEHKPNRGTIWKNDFKETDNQPDYKGDCLIENPDGTTQNLDMSAWINETSNGKKYLSFQFQEPYVKEGKEAIDTSSTPGTLKQKVATESMTDDDLPF